MITGQDIIKDISFYAKCVWKKKLLIGIVGILIAAAWSYKLIKRPPLFIANKTFMVSDDDGGGGGGLSAILGQIGLGSSSGGNYNYKKIIEIGTSNLILDQVLFEKAEWNDTADLIGNHIIKVYNLHKNWNKDTLLYNFLLSDKNKNTSKGKIVRKILESKMKGDPTDINSERLIRISLNEESSILKISGETKDANLSIVLAETLYDKLSKFYIDKSIERQLNTYLQLESKADSINKLLNGSEHSFARSSDFNRGLVLSQDRMSSTRSMREIQMYSAMYGEVIKNKETAEFMLNSQTPFFQAIDSPFLPLYNSNKFKFLQGIFGLIFGLIFASMAVLVHAYYKKEIQPLLN